MSSKLAYCGLNCAECPAYLATLNNDSDLRASTQEKWNTTEYPVTLEDINCEGCKANSGIHFKWCNQCAVRGCASKRGVESCAHCDEYICGTLTKWLSQTGDEAKERLEKIRDAL